jgi:hypothetical protein
MTKIIQITEADLRKILKCAIEVCQRQSEARRRGGFEWRKDVDKPIQELRKSLDAVNMSELTD